MQTEREARRLPSTLALRALFRWTATVTLLALSISACTETQVRSRRGRFNPEPLPQPHRIVVYDFDTKSTEVVLDPSIADEIARGRTPVSKARRQVALAVADVLAATLVEEIQALGLPAERGYGAPVPKQGALIIDGQLIRIDEGDRARRRNVGFGAGGSELRTQVQVYYVSNNGRRLIAEFTTATERTEKPETGTDAVVETNPETPDETSTSSGEITADAERTGRTAAKVLAELFVRQEWTPTTIR